MMIALNVGDANALDALVGQVADQFKLHRMIAPPDTSVLLVTIIGPMSAGQFSARWQDITRRIDIVRAFMSLMTVATVVQGTNAGEKLSEASLMTA